jgi:hypothetical protein
MAEGMNVEIAHTLHEQSMEATVQQRPLEVLEFVEALLLAVVAVATAWSGYQAAQWDGLNARLYGEASKDRATTNQLATLGGQQRLFDVVTFNTWIQATTAGNDKLAAVYARRFSPEYQVAFDAWLKTNPAHNPHAPPGPTFMPEYHNHLMEQAASLDRQASTAFARGTAARDKGDRCVLNTVLLAAVLFLVAISQRFRGRHVRLALLGAACILLAVALHGVAVALHGLAADTLV